LKDLADAAPNNLAVVHHEQENERLHATDAKLHTFKRSRAHQHRLRGQKILGADQEVLRVGVTIHKAD
jgi:hypothetical protein